MAFSPLRLTIPTSSLDISPQGQELTAHGMTASTTTSTSALIMSPAAMPSPIVHSISSGCSWTYVVADPVTEQAVIINPVLSYDHVSNRISALPADSVLKLVEAEGYTVAYILETAIHRQHISSCRYLRDELFQATGHHPSICIGRNLDRTRGDLSPERDSPERVSIEDNAFDKLWADGEKFRLGNLVGEVLYLSPTTVAYLFGTNIFVGIPGGIQSVQRDSLDRLSKYSIEHKLYGLPLADPSAPYVTIAQLQEHTKGMTLQDENRTPSPTSETDLILQFYARIVNSKAGRIPKKINLIFPDSEKGKQKELVPRPLLIPKKLEMLLC